MRLAAFTDYGLQVLMRLAGSSGELLTTQRIAEVASRYIHRSRRTVVKVRADLSSEAA